MDALWLLVVPYFCFLEEEEGEQKIILLNEINNVYPTVSSLDLHYQNSISKREVTSERWWLPALPTVLIGGGYLIDLARIGNANPNDGRRNERPG
jgi:hypothetical protein